MEKMEKKVEKKRISFEKLVINNFIGKTVISRYCRISFEGKMEVWGQIWQK